MAGLVSAIHIWTNNLSTTREAGSVLNGSRQSAFMRFRVGAEVGSKREKG